MKRTRILKNLMIILITLMGIEIIFRLSSGIKVFDVSLIRVFLGCSFFSVLISYLLSWTEEKFNKIIILSLMFFVCLYAFIQMGFNNFIGVYMSVNTSSQLGAVIDYIKEFLASFLFKYYLVFIPFLLLIVYYIFLDKYLVYKGDKKFILKNKGKYDNYIRFVGSSLALLVIGFLYYGSLSVGFMQNELQSVKTKDLFKNPNVPSIVVNEFGVLGYGFLDIKSLYSDNSEIIDINIDTVDNTPKTRSFDDTLWEEVIENETNETYKQISEYLINNQITDYNDYTGMFENKNLIVILMESANDILINEEYYPNFYKMYTNGWSFVNNYSPRNSCSTGNNEFSGMTSLYSIYNNCTANVYRKNTYGTSLFDLFNKKEYKTISMHDYTEAYYYRSTIHKNLGSSKYYGVQDLDIPYKNEYRNWASDEDFVTKAMDIMLEDTTTPFMLWLTTVTPHQPYVLSSIEGDEYLDLFEDTNYPKDLKRYMSKLKVLDNAFGILLDRLKEAGILDDTVIVFFGDHYPYGLSKKTIKNVLDYDLDNYEVERTPFLIYNSKATPTEFEQYTSFINITPTMANLFNLDYDSRMYMGSDLLSDEYESLVVFSDGSWKNELAYYNASNGKITYYTDYEYSVDEIKSINDKVTLKIKMSSLIIKNNYYERLNKQISDLKASKEETLAQSME